MVRQNLLKGALLIFLWSESISSVRSFTINGVNKYPIISGRSLHYHTSAQTSTVMSGTTNSDTDFFNLKFIDNIGSMITSAVLLAAITTGSPVYASEIGVEVEAPTLYTGETVEICTKRGPLGACLKTEKRTDENENDKSVKYFKYDNNILRKDIASNDEGNLLIERLKKQTEDNREKNELKVKVKTQLNDQGANFGPFSRSVLILNADGKGFTLLENPQAMRLKEAGFIKDKQFIKQPTQQELDDALEAAEPSALLKGFMGFFGAGKDDDDFFLPEEPTPSKTTTAELTPSTALTEEPKSSTVTEEPKYSTVTEEPKSSTGTEEPKSSIVTEESTSSTVTEEPKSSTVADEPRSSTVTEEAKSSTVTEDSKSLTVTEEPISSTVAEEPRSLAVIEESITAVKEEPTPSVV